MGDAALVLEPTHAGAKSGLARISFKQRDNALQDGNASFLGTKAKLEKVFQSGDAKGVKDSLREIKELIENEKISWDALAKSNVGKTIGAIKAKPSKGDVELANAALEVQGKLMQFIDKKCR